MAQLDNIFDIEGHKEKPAIGRILISEPYSIDTYFARSIVLIVEHNDQGTVGFILNKPIQFPINSILPNFPSLKSSISFGGPVQEEALFYIHTLGNKLPNSQRILNDLYWGGSFEVLKLLFETGMIHENEIRFFLGYSGWHSKQLDDEIDKQLWLVSDFDTATIMNKSHESLWKQAITRLDEKYHIWLNFTRNPSMN